MRTAAPPAGHRAARTDGVRHRLVDAAEVCFRRFGVTKTTLEDIASEAGVSRATIYRHVGGRDDLVLAVLLRSADRFYERLEQRVSAASHPVDALLDGVIYTVEAVRVDDELMMLFAPEAVGLTTRVVGASAAIYARTAAQIEPIVYRGQAAGLLRDRLDVDELARWLTRLVFAVLMLPGELESPCVLRTQLQRYLVPALAPDAVVEQLAGSSSPSH